jgi:hypothetical protein
MRGTVAALRWIGVVPAALAGYFIVSVLLLAKIKLWGSGFADFLFVAVFPTAAFLMAGVMTAPRKRFATAVVLTTIYVLTELGVYFLIPNPQNLSSRVTISVVICISMCVWIRQGQLPKKD